MKFTFPELISAVKEIGAHEDATRKDRRLMACTIAIASMRERGIFERWDKAELAAYFNAAAQILLNALQADGLFSVEEIQDLLEWREAGFPPKANARLRREIEEELRKEGEGA